MDDLGRRESLAPVACGPMRHHGTYQSAFRVDGSHALHGLDGIGCPKPNKRLADPARPLLESTERRCLPGAPGDCKCAQHCKTGNDSLTALILDALDGIKIERAILGVFTFGVKTTD